MALAGIALVYQATGTLNLAQLAQLAPEKLNNSQGLAAFVLLLIGFGVKAELFPVNAWVPEVYATASSRVSALLAGIVSKLALAMSCPRLCRSSGVAWSRRRASVRWAVNGRNSGAKPRGDRLDSIRC